MVSIIGHKKNTVRILVLLFLFTCLFYCSLKDIYTQEVPKVDNKELAKKYFESGKKYTEQGNYLSAIFEYEKALEYDPYLAPAWYNLGVLYGKNEVIAQVNGAIDKSITALERFLEVVDKPEQYREKIKAMITEREERLKKLKLANALQPAKNTEKIQNIYNRISSQYREQVIKELEANAQPTHNLNVDKKMMEHIEQKVSLIFKCRDMKIINKSNEIIFVIFIDKEKSEVLGGAALDVKETKDIQIPINRDIQFFITYSSQPGKIYDGGEKLFFDDVVNENGAPKPDRILSVTLTVNSQDRGMNLDIERAKEKKKIIG